LVFSLFDDAQGMQSSYYVMSPSPLVGSAQKPGEFYVMSDCPNAGKKAEEVTFFAALILS